MQEMKRQRQKLRGIVPHVRTLPQRSRTKANNLSLEHNMSEVIHLHPLVFTLQDVITGCGFLAGILVTGKAVMEHEDGKWWMYGVCPGGLAGSGDTPNEAFIDFRTRYKEALFDLATECAGFLQFQAEVKKFYAEDKREGERWDAALQFLREHEDCVTDNFKKLPRAADGDYHLSIQVSRLEKKKKADLIPANNISDRLAKAA
jgi:hypothetical protein